MKKINLLIITILLSVFSFHSCSTGADPQPVVNDLFKIPINYTLDFTKIVNGVAMEINGITLNHLNTTKDRIKSNVPDCLKAMVYRNPSTQKLDSVVMNYGNVLCYSNGMQLLGKIVVKADDNSLKKFTATLKGLKTREYSIYGDFKIVITGAEGGKDFTISSSNLKFSLTDKIKEEVYEFPISNYKSDYKFIRSEKKELDYIDDIFTFTIALEGKMPDGSKYTLSTNDDLKYTYRCKNILGGVATIGLSDLGEASVNFGNGDLDRDCDNKVTVSVEGIEYSFDI